MNKWYAEEENMLFDLVTTSIVNGKDETTAIYDASQKLNIPFVKCHYYWYMFLRDKNGDIKLKHA